VDYVKVGLNGVKTPKDAVVLLQSSVRAAKEFNSAVKVVAVGYADAGKVGSLSPSLIPEVAACANADVAMVDTFVKNGENLFDYLSKEKLEGIVKGLTRRLKRKYLEETYGDESLSDIGMGSRTYEGH
jgi:uncharacterized protein (UPF0264 family)